MPNITELDAGPLDIRPNEAGVESAARAAYRISSYGNQQAADLQRVGQEIGGAVKSMGDVALQYMEHREINTAAPHAATISASKDQSWNNYITGKDIDPNDPTRQDQINARVNNPQAAQQWREENLDPDLDKFQEAFMTQGGQRWAQDWADKYRNHFTAMAHADQATMAGEVVKANIEKTGNTLATGVFNNPSTLGASFDLLDHSITGNVNSSPTMTPDVATRVTTELKQANEEKLVQAAVQGAILKGGDWRTIANDPKYAPYIKPAENAMFEKQEKFYQKSNEVAERQLLQLNKVKANDTANSYIDQAEAQHRTVDDNGVVNYDPGYAKALGEVAVRFGDSPQAVDRADRKLAVAQEHLKELPTQDDEMVKYGLTRAFVQPQTTQQQADAAIDNAVIGRKLTPKTVTMLRKQVDDLNNLKDIPAAVLDSAKNIVDPVFPGIGRSGAYGAWYNEFINNQYLPAKRAGTLPPNALDLNDPKSMISQAISSFKPSLPQMIGANGGLGAPLPTYTTPAAKSAGAPAQPGYQKGDVQEFQGTRYQFQGGNWRDKANWKPVI